jgi:hypothetical protein
MGEKVSLPVKTKIAACWMLTISGFCIIIVGGVESILLNLDFSNPESLFVLLLSLSFFSIFITSVFLLMRKKWAWWLAIAILSGGVALFSFWSFSARGDRFGAHGPPVIFFTGTCLMSALISLILLLIDRKNFWKVAE